jgi:hypothetical protein
MDSGRQHYETFLGQAVKRKSEHIAFSVLKFFNVINVMLCTFLRPKFVVQTGDKIQSGENHPNGALWWVRSNCGPGLTDESTYIPTQKIMSSIFCVSLLVD